MSKHEKVNWKGQLQAAQEQDGHPPHFDHSHASGSIKSSIKSTANCQMQAHQVVPAGLAQGCLTDVLPQETVYHKGGQGRRWAGPAVGGHECEQGIGGGGTTQ